MERFGLRPQKPSASESRSQARPQETDLSALGKKLLFLRSLNNRGKSQVVSTVPAVADEYKNADRKNAVVPPESVNPLVHIAPPHEIAAGIENRGLIIPVAGTAVAPTDLEVATQRSAVGQEHLADANHVIPDVLVSNDVPTQFKSDAQANSTAQAAQDLSFANDPQIVQASRNAAETDREQYDLIAAQDTSWPSAPAQIPTQNPNQQLAVSSVAPAVVRPVLEGFGVFGEMDDQRSFGQNSLARQEANQASEFASGQLAQSQLASDQITLTQLQPITAPHAELASEKETAQNQQAGESNQPKPANGLVLLPAALRQQAAPENIKVLPLDRKAKSNKPLTTAKVYSTESMVGPLPNPANFLTQLDFENDFRSQAAVPVSMVRTDADASGFGPEWMQLSYGWVAPTFPHKPLYFEQTNLERYGRGPKHCVQPLYSSAHFFGSILMMPYKVLTQHPEERVYPLGNKRPGDVSPYQKRTLIGQSYPFEALRYFESCSDYK